MCINLLRKIIDSCQSLHIMKLHHFSIAHMGAAEGQREDCEPSFLGFLGT